MKGSRIRSKLFKETIYEQLAARTVGEQQEKRSCDWSRQQLKTEQLRWRRLPRPACHARRDFYAALQPPRSQILVPLGIGPQRGGDKGEIVTQPALSKAALRPQLEALLANYHGPVTHCPPALQPEPEPEALDLDDDNGCGNHESN